MPQEEEESTDKTLSFDDESDNEKSEEKPAKHLTGTSKDLPAGGTRGRKRITRKQMSQQKYKWQQLAC